MTIDPRTVESFLAGHRFAVVGASDDARSIGNSVYLALRDHGYDVVPVNPNASTVAGDACVPDLAAVDGQLDGAVIMVNAAAALDVVRQCVDRKIPRVWLFQGLGSPGARSDEAVALCETNGIEVVPGACPFMFLEPVGWFHRVHRAARRANGSLGRRAA